MKSRIIRPGQNKVFNPDGFKARHSKEPNVTEEVKQWGALVGWIRKTGLTFDEVREAIIAYQDMKKDEEENENTGG